jgi:hypothetical protein
MYCVAFWQSLSITKYSSCCKAYTCEFLFIEETSWCHQGSLPTFPSRCAEVLCCLSSSWKCFSEGCVRESFSHFFRKSLDQILSLRAILLIRGLLELISIGRYFLHLAEINVAIKIGTCCASATSWRHSGSVDYKEGKWFRHKYNSQKVIVTKKNIFREHKKR